MTDRDPQADFQRLLTSLQSWPPKPGPLGLRAQKTGHTMTSRDCDVLVTANGFAVRFPQVRRPALYYGDDIEHLFAAILQHAPAPPPCSFVAPRINYRPADREVVYMQVWIRYDPLAVELAVRKIEGAPLDVAWPEPVASWRLADRRLLNFDKPFTCPSCGLASLTYRSLDEDRTLVCLSCHCSFARPESLPALID